MLSFREQLLQNIVLEMDKLTDIQKEGNRKKEPNFLKLSKALDEFYFFNKLTIYCGYLSFRRIIYDKDSTSQKEAFELVGELSERICEEKNTHPSIQVYNEIKNLFEDLEDNSNQQLSKLEELLNKIEDIKVHHSTEETLEMYSLLTNFCTWQINHEKPVFKAPFFMISNAILNLQYADSQSDGNLLPERVFKNLVTCALGIEKNEIFNKIQTVGLVPNNIFIGYTSEVEWVEKFIDHYGAKMDPKFGPRVHSYCQALLAFHCRKFEQAYEVLEDPKYVHGLFINMDVRVLHLKIVYELLVRDSKLLRRSDIDIDKLQERLRGVLRNERNKAQQLEYHYPYYETFATLFRKLYHFYIQTARIYKPKDHEYKGQLEKLRQNIDATPFSFREWFKEKLEEIC